VWWYREHTDKLAHTVSIVISMKQNYGQQRKRGSCHQSAVATVKIVRDRPINLIIIKGRYLPTDL